MSACPSQVFPLPQNGGKQLLQGSSGCPGLVRACERFVPAAEPGRGGEPVPGVLGGFVVLHSPCTLGGLRKQNLSNLWHFLGTDTVSGNCPRRKGEIPGGEGRILSPDAASTACLGRGPGRQRGVGRPASAQLQDVSSPGSSAAPRASSVSPVPAHARTAPVPTWPVPAAELGYQLAAW